MSHVLASDRDPIRAGTAARAPARVVLNGRFLAQVATGVQRYARETVQALDRLLDASAALRAQLAIELAVPRHAATLELRRIRVCVVPWLAGHPWEQIALAWHARGGYLVNFGYSGPLAKRRQLITLHDASVRAVAPAYAWRYRLLHDTLVEVLRRRVDVMTVSQFARAELAQRYGIGDALLGTEGWQHGLAHGDGGATLRKFGLRAQGYLLAVGSGKRHKNYALLEHALALLDDFPLTVAVAGACDIGIFRDRGGVSSHVRRLGYVSEAELGHLYRHAAWFVFPSIYEGFGLPALEAMANGCPVLAASAGALPEVCGEAALYFEPHDPAALAALLQRVTREPALRRELAARGRARLAHYSWDANARILAGHLLAAAN